MNYNKPKQTYGWDNLSKFLLVAGLFTFISFGRYGFVLGIPIVAYAVYRTRSKNFMKRADEQAAFDNLIRSTNNGFRSLFRGNTFRNFGNKFGGIFGNKFGNNRNSAAQNKNYVVIICPKCGQKLRLPINKGNITASCPKCQSKIKTRT
jgi:hypothetical protein